MQKVLGAAYKWLADTLKKISTTQTQVNAAIQVVGLTVQNNTPGGGQISWSACTVFYNGTAYAIAAGSAATDALVWWNVGDAVFSHGNSYTPSPTLFPVLTNTAGTGDTTWQKVGANSIQSSQVIGGLLPPGYQIQTPATLQTSGSATTTLLSYSGSAGALLSIGAASGVNATSVSLNITVDGGATQSYPLQTAGGGIALGFQLTGTLNGVSAGNQTGWTLVFNTPFKSSILVQVVIVGWVSGGINIAASYATKV